MSSRHKAAARLRVALPADGPGVVALVVRRDDVLYLGRRGMADVEAGVAVTADTPFNLASVSKHFTAAALLQLVEQGRVALETTVAEVLPDWAAYPSARPIRMTDLLWHLSGLPDYLVVWRGPTDDAGLTNAEFLAQVLALPPRFPVGSRAEYSNTNYILLAAVLERLGGLPFGEHLRRHLFEPLGMTASGVGRAVTTPARGYKRVGDGVELSEYPIALVGHSHLYTTANDLTRWYRGLWSGAVVGPASLDGALALGTIDDGSPHEYGFGWYRDGDAARPAMGHGGSWYGYKTHVRRIPAEELTVVVLSNDEDFAAVPLTDRLADAFR